MKGERETLCGVLIIILLLFLDMLQISSSGHESVLIEDDVDAKYDALGTSIASIPKKSATWNAIMHHISLHRRPEDYKNMTPNGCNFDKNKDPGPAPASVSDLEKKIVNIFALERAEEVKRFNHKIGNEHLLFHASRFENWVGILSRGLLQPDAVTKLGVRRTDVRKERNTKSFYFSKKKIYSLVGLDLVSTLDPNGARAKTIARPALLALVACSFSVSRSERSRSRLKSTAPFEDPRRDLTRFTAIPPCLAPDFKITNCVSIRTLSREWSF